MSELAIPIISCLEVKPRQLAWQRQQTMNAPGWKAFRQCFNKYDSLKLLDASKWPEWNIISHWFSNRKVTALVTTTKRSAKEHPRRSFQMLLLLCRINDQIIEVIASGKGCHARTLTKFIRR